ncbi:MAG: YraN family protein [Proteobacteria bacterium]|nr:YraN family protein [Pseudomonadota bacterium]
MTKADPLLGKRREAEARGRRSEFLAIALLILKGYRILARRLRTPLGEIDLVARSPMGLVCFIEVKARPEALAAAQSLSDRQKARIGRAAMHYLAQHPKLARKGMRFDIIAVAPGRLPRHHRDAWRGGDAG